jgi:hypothetical protein
MIRFTRRAAMVFTASGLVAASLAATEDEAEPAEGTASGTLTVNGKVVKVAYATEELGSE